jgi:hypothetical protein
MVRWIDRRIIHSRLASGDILFDRRSAKKALQLLFDKPHFVCHYLSAAVYVELVSGTLSEKVRE